MKNLIRQNCLITTIRRTNLTVKFTLTSRNDFPVVIARRNYELSSHDLAIECGRYSNTPRELRNMPLV